ncbi:MAG: transporter substrate-binding domain-containing protein [Armatimonadota bacterium]|nr:transporter substrate-binding domain-containing protein [Armatimonadota bacterium]
MRKAWLVLSTLVLVAFVASVGIAGPLDEIKQRGYLIVGVKADFPPFGYIDERGERAGFDLDLAKELARLLFGDPSKVRFVTVTSANRIPFLQTKQIDIIVATMTVTFDRAKVVDFSQPYFCSGHLILVPQNSTIRTFQDLNGRRVATVQGSTGDRVTSVLAPQAQKITFTQNSEALLALKGGRAEAFVQDDVLLLSFAKQDPSLKVVGWPPQMPAPYAIGVRKGEKDLLAWINVALVKIRQEGVYDRLYKKWFGELAGQLLKPKDCKPVLVLP